MIRAASIAPIMLASTTAFAWPTPPTRLPDLDPDQEAPDEPAPVADPPPPAPEPAKLPAVDNDLLDKIDALLERTRDLEDSKHEAAEANKKASDLGWLRHYVTAYVDLGAFAVAGDGTGIRNDFLHQHYPQYRNVISGRWVFMGDPFTTTINTLGEPAETGDSQEVQVDTLNSHGRPTLLVNSIGLDISKAVTDEVSISTLAQLLPRPGPDQIEISYAFVEYKPIHERLLFFQAGKIDSVLGVEYRSQDAPKRLEITPSLIARYTCGRPIGVSARYIAHYPAGQFSVSAAVLSGDNFEERFEPDTEIRANKLPTAAGHLQWKFPFAQGLELGASGAFGPQDNQANTHVPQWHFGFDLKLTDLDGWNVIAEYVQGHQRGASSTDPAVDRMNVAERPTCDVADCLRYKGAYVLVSKRIDEWFSPYARLDWRDATHQRGAEFVYEANSIRGTLGVNVRFHKRVQAKLEYIANRELYVPNFPHDVITSSLVVSTD